MEGRNQAVRSEKKDILQQINDLYVRRNRVKVESKYLIPTKATLFGLDIRFRAIDQKIEEDKQRRNAFKKRSKKKKDLNNTTIDDNGNNADSQTQVNRHQLPIPKKILSVDRKPKPDYLKSVLDEDLNESKLRKTFQSKNQGHNFDELKQRLNMTTNYTQDFSSYYRNQNLHSPKSLDKNQRLDTLNQQTNLYLSTEFSNIMMDTTPTKLPILDQFQSRNNATTALQTGSNTVGLSKDFNTSVVIMSLKKKSTLDPINLSKDYQSFQAQSKYGTCFDDLIQQRQSVGVAKNQSFIKQEGLSKDQVLTEEEMLKRHQKRLQRSPRDTLIVHTKAQLIQINDKYKQQAQIEKTLERAKQYNLQNTKQLEEEIQNHQPQAIKRAKLFNDEDYLTNLEQIEKQAREIEQELEQEEIERKFQQKIKRKVEKERQTRHQTDINPSIQKGKGNLVDDDAFLFGDTIKLDQGIPTMNTKQDSIPSQKLQQQHSKEGSSHSPNFGKRAMTIQKVKTHHRNLHVSQNIIKKTSTLPSQLTHLEKMRLKELVDLEIHNYKVMSEQMYDSNKNWSQMISTDLNESRNDIMKRNKFEQLKKRFLHDFIRKTKEHILKERMQLLDHSSAVESQQILENKNLLKHNNHKISDKSKSQPPGHKQSTAVSEKSKNQSMDKRTSTTTGTDHNISSQAHLQPIMESASQVQLPDGEHQEYVKFKEDFIDYMKGIVTKGGTSTLASIAINYGNQGGLKYKRKKLRMDETVEQIGQNVRNSILQSRAQQERMGNIEQQSYKLNFRGLKTTKPNQTEI